MNIWGRLCIAAALASIFCMIMSAAAKATAFYANNRWYFCVALLVIGGAVAVMGWVRSKRTGSNAGRPSPNVAAPAQNDPEAADEPFVLLSVTFWGAMIALFGILTAFIKPQPKQIVVHAASVKAAGMAPAQTTNGTGAASQTNKAPSIKLQGIFYRKQNASVLISGKTLFVGDRVGNARIISIEPQSVTVEVDGKQQVLTLKE